MILFSFLSDSVKGLWLALRGILVWCCAVIRARPYLFGQTIGFVFSWFFHSDTFFRFVIPSFSHHYLNCQFQIWPCNYLRLARIYSLMRTANGFAIWAFQWPDQFSIEDQYLLATGIISLRLLSLPLLSNVFLNSIIPFFGCTLLLLSWPGPIRFTTSFFSMVKMHHTITMLYYRWKVTHW